MTSPHIALVDESNFEAEVMQAVGLVLIDFYADWCGPCKRVAPILEELAREYQGKLHVYKIDTEREQELAAAFGIRSIPSLLFIPMSEQPQMAAGALPKEALEGAIKDVLKVEKSLIIMN